MLMRLKAWPVLLVASAVVATVAASDGVGKLPARLAGYRSWTMTAEPRLVPQEFTVACAPPSLFEERRKRYGPHYSRWIRVYANASAASAMQQRKLTDFPVGSIIAKEKLLDPTDSSPDGLAFMIKHGKGEFTASDGWEFLYYPSTEEAGAYDSCVTCHRAGAKRDYVFGTMERGVEGQ